MDDGQIYDQLNNSALTIGSHWSTGQGGCIRHAEMFFEEGRISSRRSRIRTHSKIVNKHNIPKLNLNKATNFPTNLKPVKFD